MSFFREFLATLVALFFLCTPSLAQEVELKELIRHVDQLWRGQTSHTLMTMTVKTQRYQRTIQMEAWSKGKEHSLVLIRAPKKDKGIATLKVENNIWNYLPKINRVTKVPASMMSGSWMGSHFTNDDLVKESSFEEDYHSSITFQGEREGQLIYEITFIAKDNAAVVWERVVMLIGQENLAPIQALYYGEDTSGINTNKNKGTVTLPLVRTIQFDQLADISGRIIPQRLTLVPEDKSGESTVVTYQNLTFGVSLRSGFFSLQNLKRRR